jgi:hypothetical protein
MEIDMWDSFKMMKNTEKESFIGKMGEVRNRIIKMDKSNERERIVQIESQ